jgi:F-type H+-transporting ATPase subunit epsilon
MAEPTRTPTKLQFVVVTRDRKVLDVEVDEVMLPATNGYIGVLPGHTPLLTTLRVGEAMYRVGGRAHYFILSWGFAEVLPDRVIVMAEGAIKPEEIDRQQAEQQKKDAERELASLASHDPNFALMQGKLDESIAKLAISGRASE